MSNSTDSNNNNNDNNLFQLPIELIIRGIIGLTLAIFITCGTSINKNSKFEIILMKTTIVKTILTLGLTFSAVFIESYVALAIIFLLSFAFYWMVHGVKIYDNDINDNDKKIINDLNIKSNVLFTPENTDEDNEDNEDNFDNEKQPLLNNFKNKGKQLIINGISDAMSIISNHSGLSNLSKGIGNIIEKQSNNSSIYKNRIKSQSPSPISPLLKSLSSLKPSNSSSSPTFKNLSNDNLPIPTFDRRLLSTSTDNLLNKKRRNSTPRMISHKSDDELNNDVNDIIYVNN